MIDQKSPEHHIQKYIIGVLMHQQYARFRDMRPPKTDTNLYSYHLKLLQKNGFINKTIDGYSLSQHGMSHVDRTNAGSMNVRLQPKIITMLVIQNSDGDVLMYKKLRQPYIEQWTVPFGKVHNDDNSLTVAANREVREKIDENISIALSHVGDCYIRVKTDDEIVVSTLAHVFYGNTEHIPSSEHLQWISPHRVDSLDATPAVKQIIARTFFRDPYFFEEFTVNR